MTGVWRGCTLPGCWYQSQWRCIVLPGCLRRVETLWEFRVGWGSILFRFIWLRGLIEARSIEQSVKDGFKPRRELRNVISSKPVSLSHWNYCIHKGQASSSAHDSRINPERHREILWCVMQRANMNIWKSSQRKDGRLFRSKVNYGNFLLILSFIPFTIYRLFPHKL